MKKLTILFTSALILVFASSMSFAFGTAGESSAAPTAPASAASSISGKVAETMNSGSYTYIKIENNGKNTWVAVPAMKVKVGQDVSIAQGMPMTNFTSKTLNRTFESIIFSSGPAGKRVSSKPGSAPAAKKAVPAAPANVKVDKASGANAYTVAELYGKSTSLDKKNITLKGKVVKVSSGIMGKNWIHIQDGSADAASGNDKIIVTTQDMAAVGDVVTAKGTLYKDKDFGSGYKYMVIVEEGSISK